MVSFQIFIFILSFYIRYDIEEMCLSDIKDMITVNQEFVVVISGIKIFRC